MRGFGEDHGVTALAVGADDVDLARVLRQRFAEPLQQAVRQESPELLTEQRQVRRFDHDERDFSTVPLRAREFALQLALELPRVEYGPDDVDDARLARHLRVAKIDRRARDVLRQQPHVLFVRGLVEQEHEHAEALTCRFERRDGDGRKRERRLRALGLVALHEGPEEVWHARLHDDVPVDRFAQVP